MGRLNLTKEQEEFLLNLSRELRTQDGRWTRDPVYIVYEKQYLPTDPRIKWDDVVFVYDEVISCAYDDDDNEIRLTEDNYHEFYNGEIDMYYQTKHDKFVCMHFTEKAADLYIKQNKHNLCEPYVYVESLYRCHEMIQLRELLLSLTPKEPKVVEEDKFVVEFGPNNNIPYGQDMGFHKNIPTGVVFEFTKMINVDRMRFEAPGFGGNPYGNGAIFITLGRLPKEMQLKFKEFQQAKEEKQNA